MYDVITVGSSTRDVFMRSRQIRIMKDATFSTGEAECFALGSKIDIEEILFETGGGATNTAVGFRRQGLRISFVGRIGSNDGRGREVLRELAREGVDTSLVVRDPRHMTAYSVVLLTPRGERTVLVYRGASAKFSRTEMPWRRMAAKWLYVSAVGGNLPLLRDLFAFAGRRKISVAWNPGAAELAKGYRTLRPLMARASMVLLNKEEAAGLLSMEISRGTEAFNRLCKEMSGMLVVTEGAGGALACADGRRYRAGVHTIKVVDTTGAGDAFGCGFIGTYIRTRGNVTRSLQFATANAESVLRTVGAKAGLLRRMPAQGLVTVRRLTA